MIPDHVSGTFTWIYEYMDNIFFCVSPRNYFLILSTVPTQKTYLKVIFITFFMSIRLSSLFFFKSTWYLTHFVCFRIISFLLDGLIRWDGQHFLHVANHGYTFETNIGKLIFIMSSILMIIFFPHWQTYGFNSELMI